MKQARTTPGDHAGPDGSFPITSQRNVDAAAHLIGKAENPAEVKRNVIDIAHRKGFRIPESWDSKTEHRGGLPRMVKHDRD
jgi:hypothetical protein